MTDISGDIAIIGMAGLYPDAPDIDMFWDNILAGHDAVRDAPPEWLNGADIFDPASSDLLKIYTSKGGFLGDLARFDARAFGTMPFSVEGAQPDQFLALKICQDALEDAGYAPEKGSHERTGVIFGHAIHAHRANVNGVQQVWFHAQLREMLSTIFPEADPAEVAGIVEMMQDRLPRISTDSTPGLVPNILTGRIANRLDLMGPNYVIDAACSSSLISVDLAMTELRKGNADLMLAGGVNTTTSPLVYSVFCGVDALSRDGRIRPFSTQANGTVLGEGVGAVVLKRLDDALASDDRIYAVIKAVGQSSDGKSSGLMAPRLEGEVLAMRRAYEHSGIDPASIGLIEAHGTGIPLGDQTEIAAMRHVFGDRAGAVPSVPVGSVKSMIGHCIPAAGSAAIIKNALALSCRILPPTLCDEVSPDLGFDDTPFYVATQTRPWLHTGQAPRRAAINAFGFGGITAHMILEEPPGAGSVDATAAFLRPADTACFTEAVFLLRGATATDIAAAARQLADDCATLDPAGFEAASRASWAAAEAGQGEARRSIVAQDPGDLAKKLGSAEKKLTKGDPARLQTRNGIYFEAAPLGGKIAVLFPGEMAQYPNLMQEAVLAFPDAAAWLDDIGGLFDGGRETRLRDIAFPPSSGLSEAVAAQLGAALHRVDYGSELVFAADQMVFELLGKLGVQPDGMLGHSTGENAALVASGRLALSRAEVGAMIGQMNTAFAAVEESGVVPKGVLMTVASLPKDALDAALAQDDALHFTMDNCPNQAVVFGPEESIDRLQKRLVEDGAICTRLPISWGYHTEFVRPMAAKFGELAETLTLEPSEITLYSCATAAPFPDDRDAFFDTAVQQYVSRVRFTEAVERLYADGYRTFVECGPNATLTPFVRDILGDRVFVAEASDNLRRGMVSQLRHLVARLSTAGHAMPYPALLNPEETPAQARRQAARARHAAAPPLDDHLPFVRFSKDEGAEIRARLGLGAAGATAATAPAQPAPQPVAHPAMPAPDRDAATRRHLGMMDAFLQGQGRVTQAALGHPVAAAAGRPAPGVRTDGQTVGMIDLTHYFQLPFAFQGYLFQGAPDPALVAPYLSAAEQAEGQALSQKADRWLGWALARLAAKRAARTLLAGDGLALADHEIEIRKAEGGAPYLGIARANGRTPSVSLSHVGDIAGAFVAAPSWRVGLDYERVDRVRAPEDFIARILSDSEKAALPGQGERGMAVTYWAIKEAAAKAIGTGLTGQPERFEIAHFAPAQGLARVAHGGITVDTRFAQIGDGLCALGFFAAS